MNAEVAITAPNETSLLNDYKNKKHEIHENILA